MPSVPLPLVGPAYENRSAPVNKQITQNFHIEVNDQGGEAVALVPFPGFKPFGVAGLSADRGFGEYLGVGYKVSGNELYSFNSAGTTTLIGTIPGTDQCVLESDGVVLVITYGSGKPISWDGTTLTTGTNVNLPNASTVAFIKRRVVYDGIRSDLAFSTLDAALTIAADNVTKVDTTPKDTLAVAVQDQQVIVFSEDSITPYYNSATGNPPYDTIQNATRKVGLKAIHSIAQDANFIYFLDDKLRVCRYSGLQVQSIGNVAIGKAIAGYPNPQDAKGMAFTLDEVNFYCISFPNEATWLFKENVGWTNLAFGVDGSPHLMNSYIRLYEKHLIADRRNGNIYELDFDTFTDNGEIIQHQRDTINISGKTFQKPGALVFWDRVRIVIEGGTSLITGQGSDARIIMSYSDDFGNTFSPERNSSIGEQGDYGVELFWDGLGSSYNRMFRFLMYEPVKCVFISLSADIELELI
ncbi:MAG: hypothetical protein V3U84_11545 [Thiotrichaceae bacterium]